MRRFAVGWLLMAAFGVVLSGKISAEDAYKTYTNPFFLYTIDYPFDWKVREISKVAVFVSPLDSDSDQFSENVNVVGEDLSHVPSDISLIDYHRKATGGATKTLAGFKVLEEAQTEWIGKPAVVIIYTALIRGEKFKFKAYTVMVDKTAYVLTYTAKEADFEAFLPDAERLMRSIRVSP